MKNKIIILFFALVTLYGCRLQMDNAYPSEIMNRGRVVCHAVNPEGWSKAHAYAVPDSVGQSNGFHVYYVCDFPDNSGPYFAYILSPPFEGDSEEAKRKVYRNVGNCTVAFLPMGEHNRRLRPTAETAEVLTFLASFASQISNCQLSPP